MDLDVLFDNNEIVEKSEEFVKEEVKEGGTKSTQMQAITGSNVKALFINNFSGGDDIKSIVPTLCGTEMVEVTITTNNNIDYRYRITDIYGTGQYKIIGTYYYDTYPIITADDTCIGFTFYRFNNNYFFVETTPKTGQSTDNPTVSGNNIDYTEYLETIIERLEGIEEYVQSISNNIVSIGNGSGDSNNSQVGSVSQNILTTPINEYGLTDSLLFVGLGVAFVTLVIVVVRRLIYKWS